MSDRVDVYATAYGSDPARAVARSAAHLGYETSRGRPPDDLDVEFCDYNFRDRTPFEDHLRAVEREQPALAVAPDVTDEADLDRAIEQADELAEHADDVVMVPKGVEPTEIPDRHRVGLPLANWDMGDDAAVEGFYDTTGKPQFHPWIAYQDVDSVHLLGGGPKLQLEVSKYNVPVESVDGASALKAAQKGGLFTPEKWLKVTPECPGLYEAMKHSLDNLVRAWSVRYSYDPPISSTVYDASECADEIREAAREAREAVEQDRAYRDAGHGPAYIEAGDEDLWGPQDYENGTVPEAVDWAARIDEAEQQATAAARRELEMITDGGQPDLGTYTVSSGTEDPETEADTMYDPTDDVDDDTDSPKILGFGDYREQGLERLNATPHLSPIKSFASIDELVEAVEEIHVPGYSSPPEQTMERLRATYEDLPSDEARRYYLNDYKLVRTVNAARRAFNDWVSRKKRYDQIPGWAEAGPSNYPVRKQTKARDSERTGRETLDEKLDRLAARVKGARQRALKKAGTSVAEQNEQAREADRAEGREKYEKGDLVVYKHYVQPWGVYGVKKVNQKSLSLSSPHPNPGETPEWGTKGKPNPDFQTTNAKLDRPQAIKGPIPPEEWEELDERHGLPRDYHEAQIELFGEAWVNRHLADDRDDRDDTDDTTSMSSSTLADQLRDRGVPAQGAQAIATEYDDLEAAFDALPSEVSDLRGVGPASVEAWNEARDTYTNPAADAYKGEFKNQHMENAHYWAAQVRRWMFDGPNAGLEGTFYVEIIGGKAVLVLDDSWSESNTNAILDALRDEDFPQILPKNVKELDDETRVFINPTDDRLLSYYDNDWRNFESDSNFQDTVAARNEDQGGDEWRDDRPQQGTLGTEDATQYRESRMAEGSDQFADDRVYDPREDVAEQAGLFAEKIEGQASLTGDEAEVRPAWEQAFEASEETDTKRPKDPWGESEIRGKRLTREKVGQIRHHAGNNDLSLVLSSAEIDGFGNDNLRTEVGDVDGLVAYFAEHGGFSEIDKVGPTMDARLVEIIPLVADERPDDADVNDWDAGAVAQQAKYATEAKQDALYELSNEDAFGPAFDGYTEDELARLKGVSASDWDDPYQHDERERPEIRDAEDEMFAAFAEKDDADQKVRDYLDLPETVGEWTLETVSERMIRYHRDDGATVYAEPVNGVGVEVYHKKPGRGVAGEPQAIGTFDKLRSAADAMVAHIEGEQPDGTDTDDSEAQQDEFEDVDEDDTETVEVEFVSRDAANAARDDLPDGVETAKYDRRHKTVEVYVGALSESEREQFEAAAMDARRDKDVSYGQTSLTDNEKRLLNKREGWIWGTKGFHAQASKAILQAHGVDDWLSHYDQTFDTAAEHLSVVPDRGQESDELLGIGTIGHNQHQDVEEDAPQRVEREGKLAAKAHSDECKQAEKWCGKGDEGACIHLTTECGWTDNEIDDMRADVEEMEVRMDALITDDGGPIDKGEPAIEPEAVGLAGDTEQLPPFALRTLQRAWNGYRAAALEAEEHKKAVERYNEARREAREYGSMVNEVRRRFGQDPMDIEATVTVKNDDGEKEQRKVRLADLPELTNIEWDDAGTTQPTAETEGTTLNSGWSSLDDFAGSVYDPVAEVKTDGGVAVEAPAASPIDAEYQQAIGVERVAEDGEVGGTRLGSEYAGLSAGDAAEKYHREQRSPKAQDMDESIQAREQVAGLEGLASWLTAPNMMDFVGVDDMKMMGLGDL